MDLPNILPQSQLGTNDYMVQADPAAEKKKKALVVGGIVLLLIVFFAVVFRTPAAGGELQMRSAIQSTSDAVGIVNNYQPDLTDAQTENNVALVQALLIGNYSKLSILYSKTYKSKTQFMPNPMPDAASVATLTNSVQNNTIDNDIFTILQPKIQSAEQELAAAKPSFAASKSATQQIDSSIKDLNAVSTVLSSAATN